MTEHKVILLVILKVIILVFSNLSESRWVPHVGQSLPSMFVMAFHKAFYSRAKRSFAYLYAMAVQSVSRVCYNSLTRSLDNVMCNGLMYVYND